MIIAGKIIKCKCGDCNFLQVFLLRTFYAAFNFYLHDKKNSHDSDGKVKFYKAG